MKIIKPHRCPLNAMTNHPDLPPAAKTAVTDHNTIHYSIAPTPAAHMMEDETPMPSHVQAAIRWPHQGPTCVHYEPPVKLVIQPGEQDSNFIIQGIIVLPENDQSTSEIITFGTELNKPYFQKTTIDTTTGSIVLDYQTLSDFELDESNRDARYYARLARHITRSLQAQPPNPTGPRKKAVVYATEILEPGTPRPELEERIRQAGEKPRPFDIVIIASRWVLGTENEADNTIARLQEHGVEVAFVDERME